MKDDKGFTLLHHSALKMKADKIKVFIDYARRTQSESDEEILKWVKATTSKEKFTPLHFASFKGCLKCTYVLIENGADINVTNAYGLNLLHVAA